MSDGQTPTRPSLPPLPTPPAPVNPALVEGVDYAIDARGLLVFTSAYLRRRGTCCGNKCRHCPYEWREVPASRRVPGETPPRGE